ncbi:hypothetical protein Rsub_09169 [Raphidocelis subcapitata]|uniref:DUF4524 domain-containing protein n=1 Tax=Raphidocelis subcapitata TaxID=307507 RepID=A0A2V0PEQ4_9CHLO|nr:hypothetical protein Rsub_09169 [Raphidocelis subcapitata]|eukprot:GBF96370.1 hypothetical protein Rsub_09169 [Raphidocelis subcapitata]
MDNAAGGAATPAPQLCFAALAADGRLKALWDDNTVLLLSSGGEAFATVPPRPGAAPTRQLSEFALSRSAPRLAQALRLRNLHADAPAYCRPLARAAEAAGDVFQLGYPITTVYWPASVGEALRLGLLEVLDAGRVAARSRCGSARVVLDAPARLRFAVCYPLLLRRSSGGGGPSGGGGAGRGAGGRGAGVPHVWQTQVFSTRRCPPRWAPALAVVAAAADALAPGGALAALPRPLAPGGGEGGEGGYARPEGAVAEAAAAAAAAAAYSDGWFDACGGGPWDGGGGGAGWGSDGGGSRCASPSHCGGLDGAARRGAWRSPSPGVPEPPGADAAGEWEGGEEDGRLAAAEAMTRLPDVIWPDLGVAAQGGGGGGGVSGRRPSSGRGTAPAASSSGGNSAWFADGAPTSGSDVRALALGPDGGCAAAGAWARPSRPASAGAAAGGVSGGGVSAAVAGLSECFPSGSWWFEASPLLPTDLPLTVLWTPEATYTFLQDCGEVEAWLHEDDSVMTTAGPGFVHHPLPGEAEPRTYAAGGLPDKVFSAATGRRLAVGAVAAHALKLRAAMAAACQRADAARRAAAASVADAPAAPARPPPGEDPRLARARAAASGALSARAAAAAAAGVRPGLSSGALAAGVSGGPLARPRHEAAPHPCDLAPPPRQLPPPEISISNEILEQQVVPGVGRLTAYEDGRVRALFEDRTILSLDARRAEARLTLPDGRAAVVAAANPVGVEGYVSAALQFAAWAFRTPAERDALLRARARVEAELDTTARMAAICEYGSQSKPPATAPAGSCLRGRDQSPPRAAPGALAWSGADAPAGGGAKTGALLGLPPAASEFGRGGDGGGGSSECGGSPPPWELRCCGGGGGGGGGLDSSGGGGGGGRGRLGWSIAAAAEARERAVAEMLARNAELMERL